MKAFIPLLFVLAACSSTPSADNKPGRLDSLYSESTRLHKENRQIMDSMGAIMEAKRTGAAYADDSTYRELERRKLDNELQMKANDALIEAAK